MDTVTDELLPDRKHAPVNLGDVLILGLGKSGRSAAEYCLNLLGTRVNSLGIAAGKATGDTAAFGRACAERGAQVTFDTYDIAGSYDLCIASPGISMFEEFYRSAAAHSKRIVSEVEFAWCESDARSTWVAITGTNGKTTTTAAIAHILRAAGMSAAAVGNIGDTCLDAVAAGKTDVYVAEVSSYQLASTCDFAPEVSVLLNITPDHIHWHKTHEAYVEAKRRVFANAARVHGLVILDAVNDETRAIVREMKSISADQRCFDYLPLGTAQGYESDMRRVCGAETSAFLDDGCLTVCLPTGEYRLLPASELLIRGTHNVANALAAAACALHLGVQADTVSDALRTFAPLEHRIEPCGSIGEVECFNDSKATNVDATLKAFGAFMPQKPIVLLGGDDKGTSLTELVEEAQRHAKAVVCFGDAEERFAAAFEPSTVTTLRAPHMAEALDTALGIAEPGDVILLSPACASFDEFSCFEERGEVFKRLVREHGGD